MRHHNARLRHVDGHTLTGNQRSFDDVLVRITYADDRPDLVEYASPGRARYMLTRYTPEKFNDDPAKAYAKVEKVRTR